MKKSVIIFSTLILLGLVNLVPVFAESTNTLVSVTADYWMPSLDAEVKSSDLSIIGTTINLVDDLGMDDPDSFPAFKASVDLPLFPELVISYFSFDGSSSKNITQTFTYKGKSYSASNNVASSYDITQYEAYLRWNLLNMDAGKLGFLIGSKYFEVKTELKDNTAGFMESESVSGPVPIVGFGGDIKLPAKFRIEGIVRGLVLEINDIDAKMFDVETALNYDFNRFIRATAGYRYFLIDAEETSNNDSVNIKFAGPYFGVTASF